MQARGKLLYDHAVSLSYLNPFVLQDTVGGGYFVWLGFLYMWTYNKPTTISYFIKEVLIFSIPVQKRLMRTKKKSKKVKCKFRSV